MSKNWKAEFEKFDQENPHVYALFKKYSKMAKDRGYKRFSAKAVFERLRWYYAFETKSNDEFKLNNSYTAYYARKLMSEFPEFADFFETRERIRL